MVKRVSHNRLPHQYLGPGIFALNAAHVIRAGCFVVYVGHASKVKRKK